MTTLVPPRVLALAGSARAASLNKRLLAVGAAAARAQGAQLTAIDLRDYAMPLYDGDLEAANGQPQAAHELRRLCLAHDALLLATPEYNGFVTPLLVNTFAWLSRLPEGEGLPSGLQATAGVPVALLSASPGGLGGLRSLLATRHYLSMNLGFVVMPEQFALPQAHLAFDDAGALKEPRQQQAVAAVVAALLKRAAALAVRAA